MLKNGSGSAPDISIVGKELINNVSAPKMNLHAQKKCKSRLTVYNCRSTPFNSQDKYY